MYAVSLEFVTRLFYLSLLDKSWSFVSLFQYNTGYEDEDTAFYQDDEVVVEDVSCCESTCNDESNLRPEKDEPFMVLNEGFGDTKLSPQVVDYLPSDDSSFNSIGM